MQSITLEVGGVKVNLQYCPARSLVEEWINIGSLPSDSPLFLLPVSSLVTLNAYRDFLNLRKLLQPPAFLSAFHAAHRVLKQFLTTQGLSGTRFGFLGRFSDVMNQLLWDPVLGKDDYAVGYEDRVFGNSRVDVEGLGDEGDPPTPNRIVADGGMLWDRRRKIDLVFGSGFGARCSTSSRTQILEPPVAESVLQLAVR
ncbi:hypothetical protein BDP27DRAFT_1373070 [Rhodocollybia butyracea]|uniref:MJ1316 RNA cyclic group end recognition domain-containing protein n=1 Tax=Rhodocollybia butyracea TaxID=206335 RepID=A0A9P5TXE2_9AGAR|nr:hypothetical protein BDP27DRAFT_1373070 [Rhodocollybia butyracea]